MEKRINSIYKLLIRAMKVLFIIIALYLAILVFTSSARLNPDINWFEFYYDNVIVNLLAAIVLILVMCGLAETISKIEYFTENRIILIQILLLGTVCIILNYITNYVPVADQRILTRIARFFLDANYYEPERVAKLKEYLEVYPFQVGIASVYQLIIGIVGMENFTEGIIAFNTFCYLVSLFFLSKTTLLLFQNRKVLLYQVLLTIGFTPWLIYTGFIYGDIPSLMATLGAVYFWLLYQQDNRKKGRLIACIVSFSFGYYMKTNELLFILAFMVYAVLKCMRERRIKYFFIAILIYILSVGTIELAKNYYNNQYEMEMNQGSPLFAHIYMGLCEDGDTGPGRYTGYVYSVYKEFDGDNDSMREDTNLRIMDRITYYAYHPKEALSFFHRKNMSNYGEPLFEAIESNNIYEPEERYERIVNSIHHGKIYYVLRWIENIHQCVLYLFILGYAVLVNVTGSNDEFLSVIYYIGIFITFLFWEGWGKYVMPAIIFMIPHAALAMDRYGNYLTVFFRKRQGN